MGGLQLGFSPCVVPFAAKAPSNGARRSRSSDGASCLLGGHIYYGHIKQHRSSCSLSLGSIDSSGARYPCFACVVLSHGNPRFFRSATLVLGVGATAPGDTSSGVSQRLHYAASSPLQTNPRRFHGYHVSCPERGDCRVRCSELSDPLLYETRLRLQTGRTEVFAKKTTVPLYKAGHQFVHTWTWNLFVVIL